LRIPVTLFYNKKTQNKNKTIFVYYIYTHIPNTVHVFTNRTPQTTIHRKLDANINRINICKRAQLIMLKGIHTFT